MPFVDPPAGSRRRAGVGRIDRRWLRPNVVKHFKGALARSALPKTPNAAEVPPAARLDAELGPSAVVLVCLGATAAKSLLGPLRSVQEAGSLRGRPTWRRRSSHRAPVVDPPTPPGPSPDAAIDAFFTT